jgi:hypothetical protein
MEYVRLTSIEDPLFRATHELLGRVFPKEEVLAYERWEEPLRDKGIYVYAALPNRPDRWHAMMEALGKRAEIALLPL